MGALARLGRKPVSVPRVRGGGARLGHDGKRARPPGALEERAHLDPVGRAGRAPGDGPYAPAQTWGRRHELLLALPLYVVRAGSVARAASRLGHPARLVKRWLWLARWYCARAVATVDGVLVRIPATCCTPQDAKVRELLARFVDGVSDERGAA